MLPLEIPVVDIEYQTGELIPEFEKKLHNLWMLFLTRVNEKTDEIPPELLENDLTREAVGYMERAAYSKAQLEAYDKFKDIIMTEKSIIGDALKKGREEGETIGLEKVIANGHKAGYTVEIMATMTGLTTVEVRKIIEGL